MADDRWKVDARDVTRPRTDPWSTPLSAVNHREIDLLSLAKKMSLQKTSNLKYKGNNKASSLKFQLWATMGLTESFAEINKLPLRPWPPASKREVGCTSDLPTKSALLRAGEIMVAYVTTKSNGNQTFYNLPCGWSRGLHLLLMSYSAPLSPPASADYLYFLLVWKQLRCMRGHCTYW